MLRFVVSCAKQNKSVHYFDEQHASQVWTHRPPTGVGRTDRYFGRRPSRPRTDGDAGRRARHRQDYAGPIISARRSEPRCASTVGLVPRTGRRSSILALDAVDSRPGRDDRRWATPPRHGPGGRGHRPVSPRIGRHLGWIGEATGTGTGASPFPPVLLHHDILDKGQPVSAVAARP